MFKLPPLNALRAFEVAARHRSMKDAASELHVTPGAISRHVQNLEDILGAPLFERHYRELQLTPLGSEYMTALTDAFARIDEATRRLLDRHSRRPLHIWSSITFTMRWLVPRLPRFHLEHPELDVRFTTSLKPLDFAAEKVDVAIRNHALQGPGLISHHLFDTDLVPACSPALAAGETALSSAGDLTGHTLLHSSVRAEDWRKWLAAAGMSGLEPAQEMTFESSSLAYEAAMKGLGVVIAQRALVADDLAAGRLATPLEFALKGEAAFFLTYREQSLKDQQLIAFRDWILDEATAIDAPN